MDINNIPYSIISMTNPQRFSLNFDQPNQQQECQIKTYACLQQKQTIDFLTYLTYPQNDNRNNVNKHINKNEQYLYFNSQADDAFKNNKKTKVFGFDAIYNRTEKIKYVFGKMIKQVADHAFKGQNQTCFIYGTEQKCKDKILFGQSQNHGIFLCILAQLFQRCHQKALQDQVTIKFSCAMFSNAKFINILTNRQDMEIEYRTDVLEGGTIQSIPQIIIRNIKTGLKLLNMVLKQINDIRDEKITQNLILTLKIELDCKRQRDQTTVYCISKINFIKFANPSINSILKGINKNNVWFVNLFNYIQSTPINTASVTGKQNINMQIPEHSGNIDQFTQYLQQVCFKGNHKIFGFVSISNKMTSNQCLTALLFANYLKLAKIKSKKYFINLPELTLTKSKDRIKILQAIKQRQNILNLWALFTQLLQKYMNQLNYLQFQYSLVIGEACEKLNKYIFTEELQDFFYAKKINIQRSQDLIIAHNSVADIRNKLKQTQKLIIQQLNDSQIKDVVIDWLNSQYSLAHHFLLDDSQTCQLIKSNLQKFKQRRQAAQSIKNKKYDEFLSKYSTKILKQKLQEFQKKNQKINSENILKNEKIQLNEKENKIGVKSALSSIHMRTTKYKDNSVDYLEFMFTNKNVGITNKKF